MQTIVPILRYEDARAAIRWLGVAFGFTERFSEPETGPFVRHAQLVLGSYIIMLGSTRNDGMVSPQASAATQGIYVFVDDLDARYERALAAGADAHPPYETDFGSREFLAHDMEGHPWTFGTYPPE